MNIVGPAHSESLRTPTQELLRAQLEQAQRQLLQSEKMAAIGQLAAGVAHEINNPIGYVYSNIGSLAAYVNDMLRLIRAYENAQACTPEIQRLRREIDIEFITEDVLQLIAESQDGIDRVTHIVHSLKDFSRSDDGGEFAPADLRQCIESTLNVVNNEIKYKAEVHKAFADLPLVECRQNQISQVVMNLLVNAAQAIEQQGRITVRTSAHEHGALIEISDNGRGIAPQHLHRVFDPFFTTKPVGQGTGLGLSLSYGIVKDHGGWIKADSELGIGTRFRVWLPLRQAGDATGARMTAERAVASASAAT